MKKFLEKMADRDLVKGYYCLTRSDRELYYVPRVLFAHKYLHSCNSRFVFKYEPRLLQRIPNLIKEGKINLDSLNFKEWEATEVEIPQKYVRSFIDACFFSGKKKVIKKMARSLCEFLRETAEGIIEKFEGNESFHYEEYYFYEDDGGIYDDKDDDLDDDLWMGEWWDN